MLRLQSLHGVDLLRVPTYSQHGGRTLRRLAVLTGIFLATIGILGIALAASAAPADQPAAQVLLLNAGEGEGVISMNGFNLPNVRVAEGTTITWTNMGNGEPHTVTFLAGRPRPFPVIPQPEDPSGRPPMLNPDMFFPTPPTGPYDGTSFINLPVEGVSQQASITFSKAGRYEYVCLYHPPMAGTVEVVAAGSPGITTQAEVNQSIATHTPTAHLPIVRQAIADRSVPDRIEAPDGSSLWVVRAGSDQRYSHTDILGFLPAEITIMQGDSIGWYVDHAQPHTITFPAPGAAPPDLILVQLPDGTTLAPDPTSPPPVPQPGTDPSMLPRLVLGPGAQAVRPSPLYDGASFYNSGFIGQFGDASLGPNTWALTFPVPGGYEYLCLLHAETGMAGKVTVLPRS